MGPSSTIKYPAIAGFGQGYNPLDRFQPDQGSSRQIKIIPVIDVRILAGIACGMQKEMITPAGYLGSQSRNG
jgi:hypothetical protein